MEYLISILDKNEKKGIYKDYIKEVIIFHNEEEIILPYKQLYNIYKNYIKNKKTIKKNKLEINNNDVMKFIKKNGDEKWYLRGVIHRDNGPALKTITGNEEWYQYGELHRLDGPAIIYKDRALWYKNGKFHRIGGPAYITDLFKEWYINGLLHRKDGPAYEDINGTKAWYINGVYHREDGPACVNKEKFDYYLNGVKYNENTYKEIIKRIKKYELKALNKYARRWYQLLDQPGTKIWENNIKKGWDEVDELQKNEY